MGTPVIRPRAVAGRPLLATRKTDTSRSRYTSRNRRKPGSGFEARVTARESTASRWPGAGWWEKDVSQAGTLPFGLGLAILS